MAIGQPFLIAFPTATLDGATADERSPALTRHPLLNSIAATTSLQTRRLPAQLALCEYKCNGQTLIQTAADSLLIRLDSPFTGGSP